MPSRQKTLKTLFVETVLFISLFALVGHLSVNFWERYVIQSELSKMKSSLHTLKDTINHIGIAYNQLHRELQGLADIAERETLAENIPPEKFEKTRHTALAQKLLEDIQVQALLDGGINLDNIGKSNKKTQTVENKDTQITINDTTSPHLPPLHKGEKKDENIGTVARRNKKTHMHVRTMPSRFSKNAATASLYPRKSVAAGTGKEASELTTRTDYYSKNQKQKQNNIHKCRNNNYCTTEDLEYDTSKF